ncbi:MAG: hypothetical protein CMA59_02500 [Euryarchaeota archaeon]|nr:hypothetical protein [Euryarchaeota archaeon]
MLTVDVFLVGVPKAGTTWLSNILDQHHGIILSAPKEPNFVASHKGTFERDGVEPDWSKYGDFFMGDGLKMDASVHTFSCPIAPERIKSNFPDARFILCLREPVSRTVSHWNMVRSTGEDRENDRDWSDFEEAWSDDSLRVESMYGTSMKNWLEHFDLDRFMIIDSSRMRSEPMAVVREVEGFLGVEEWDYDVKMDRHANAASSNRKSTAIGNLVMFCFSLVPKFVKSPVVKFLQRRDWNIYRLPVLSTEEEYVPLGDLHFSTCGGELCDELSLFGSLTGFDHSEWENQIRTRIGSVSEDRSE